MPSLVYEREIGVVAALAVAVGCTRPRAIPLAMITMRKSLHWFSLIPHVVIGLHLEAIQAAGASL